MKTRNLLYLISLMAIIFISIPKISNAAPPDEDDCCGVYIECPDGSIVGMGIVCNDSDYDVLQEIFCNPIVVSPGTNTPAN